MQQTSQSWLAEGRGGSADAAEEDRAGGASPATASEAEGDDELVLEGGSADVADQEAGADADADAADEAPPSITPTKLRADADSAEEGGVGEGHNDAEVAEFDVPVTALGCFPPFFFVMAWCVGLLEV